MFGVLVDGSVVNYFTPTSTSYAAYSTAPFSVTAGTHLIQFSGFTFTGDNTAFIDHVIVAKVGGANLIRTTAVLNGATNNLTGTLTTDPKLAALASNGAQMTVHGRAGDVSAEVVPTPFDAPRYRS